MTYSSEVTKQCDTNKCLREELDRITTEYARHMRSCQVRSQRFETEKQALKRPIEDLSHNPESSRQLSDASTNLSQAKHEIRMLKQTMEQKDRTIDQLKENVKALKAKTTLGSECASSHKNGRDPLKWPVDRQYRVLS